MRGEGSRKITEDGAVTFSSCFLLGAFDQGERGIRLRVCS